MAKKTATTKGKLAGKTVAFVGKFGYADMWLEQYQKFATLEGGKVVDAASTVPDYLIAGEGRGGNPPAIVAKVQAKHPAVQVLDGAGFCQLLLPTGDELIAILNSEARDYGYWELFQAMLRNAGASIDLSGADLRKANLHGADLKLTTMDGADLRGTSAEYTHFPCLNEVKLNNADLNTAYLIGAANCSFRKANMADAWFHDVRAWNQNFSYANCDFSGATITKAKGDRTHAPDCIFRDADLSSSEFEESEFERADFTNANLSGTKLHKSKFRDAKFNRANLHRADLRDASLANADLTKANLREAVLIGADLTGAKIDGADFTGANLTAAKVAGLDPAKAKNFQMRPPRKPGPKLAELVKVAAASQKFETSAELDLGDGNRAVLTANGRIGPGCKFYYRTTSSFCSPESTYGRSEHHQGSSFQQEMIAAAERWSIGKLRFDSIKAKGSKCPIRGQELLDLALAAWCEACGVDMPSPAALQQKKAEHEAQTAGLREAMLADIRGGPAGIKKWNARPSHERAQIGKLRKLDFSKAKLAAADLEDCDLQGCNFDGAHLKNTKLESTRLEKARFANADLGGASLRHSHCSDASFEGANLKKCELAGCTFRNVNFRNADLSGSEMHYSDLRGADLSTAKIDGVNFEGDSFDEKTQFPAGFVPPENMLWKGVGARPGTPPPPPPPTPGTLDFETFFEHLSSKVEAARMQKATAMLKAEKFQLFADVKADSLVGVVKSQSNADLVYSSRLCSDGKFSCCTQNLNPCGGLRGALCKHLLVLVIGLARAGQLDPATVNAWVDLSHTQKPEIDKDVMSETFLRYKGAEAGEVDWRPTETIPEDYYAL